MILQAYDFVELAKRHNCRVQMGGSDQWGNIINGVELARRSVVVCSMDGCKVRATQGSEVLYEETFSNFDDALKKHSELVSYYADENTKSSTQPALYGITSPLLTTSSGAKMGKTASGAVWLNADMLSPYDYWQYWRNTEDGDVIRFLKLFTELPLEQIAEYEGWLGSAKINDAKIILATEATTLLHGREAAEKAARTAAETFSGSGVSADLPEITITNIGASIIELLVTAEFAASNGEARRLIQGNGISLNDVKVTDENHRLSDADFAQGFAKLSKGKKQHVLIKIA
jgi:tyrosyl-tRNA synthetase